MNDLEKAFMSAGEFEPAKEDDKDVDTNVDVDVDKDKDVDVDKDKDVDTDVDKDKDKDVDVDTDKDVDSDKDKNTDKDVDKDKKVLLDTGKENTTGAEFETSLSEKSKGRFKNYADVETALEDASQNAFANDMVAKLNDYVKSGGEVNDFMRTQIANYGELSDVEAIKEQAFLFDKTLSREDIDLLIEDEYGISPEATDREKRLAEIKIKRAGAEAKNKLTEYQKEWAVPQVTNEEAQALRTQEAENWKNELASSVDGSAEMNIKIGDEDFKYNVTDEAKTVVKENHDLSKFWNRYANADGKGYNVEKFVKDMYILNNFDDIVKSIVTFAKGKGTGEVVDEIKNPNFKGGDKSGGDKTGKSVLEQIGSAMFA